MVRSITKFTHVDSTTAESIAALYGVLLGQELGAGNLIFEGDANQVV
jgi:hypothetical protein